MKFGEIGNLIGLDRLATEIEVRFAMSYSSQGAPHHLCVSDDFAELKTDFSGQSDNLPEDILWLAMASQALACVSN